MEWALFFLLLPVAALSGWLIGRSKNDRREGQACADLNVGYLKGLNYLLNEQSDKAIEVFVQMLEVDSETVETHFALGNLFLRRGEVDRAIRIHQNLIARPTLTQLQRQQALFELGKDYLRAGLLDRAESLFIQASDNHELAPLALKHLLEVYQLEKEWHKAIEIAHRLHKGGRYPELQPMIAHFMCEVAEDALRNKHDSEALKLLRAALDEDPCCVRATLLEAQIEMAHQRFHKVISVLQRIEKQDAAYLSESYSLLRECHKQLGSDDELLSFLARLINERIGGYRAVLFHAQIQNERQGSSAAIASIMCYLKETPSLQVMKKLLEMKLQNQPAVESADLVFIDNLIGSHLMGKASYQCRNCGFLTRSIQWQCPTCKAWNSVRPILGIEGE